MENNTIENERIDVISLAQKIREMTTDLRSVPRRRKERRDIRRDINSLIDRYNKAIGFKAIPKV